MKSEIENPFMQKGDRQKVRQRQKQMQRVRERNRERKRDTLMR